MHNTAQNSGASRSATVNHQTTNSDRRAHLGSPASTITREKWADYGRNSRTCAFQRNRSN